ncbi:MAG TPA: hypothetical protein VMV46_06320 [Thermoanaerobaculia bacterium]|nr:hypothetical protein [Thermoanaerobaculia bacterium]
MSSMILVAAGAGALALGWLAWRGWRGSRIAELRRLASSLGIARADAARVKASGWLDGLDASWPAASIENPWSGEVAGSEVLLFERRPAGRAADPIALFRVESRQVPAFDLTPRDGPTAGGAEQVTFAVGERFAELYRLACVDPAITQRLFRPEVTRFFERAENLDWRIASDGRWLGIAPWPLGERRRRLSAKHLAAFFEDAKLVFRVLMGEPPRPRIGGS